MFTDSPTLRKVIYGIAIAANVASLFLATSFPELAAAFLATSTLLTTVAGVTAISNVPRASELPADIQDRFDAADEFRDGLDK